MEANDDGARSRLTAERRSCRRRIDALSDAFHAIVAAAADVATDDEHDPEGHTIAWERQQLASLLDEARTALADVERAIARLDAGTHGRCVTCGAPIGSDRLDALPATTTCVVCAR